MGTQSRNVEYSTAPNPETLAPGLDAPPRAVVPMEGTDRRLAALESDIHAVVHQVVASGQYLLSTRVRRMEEAFGAAWGINALAASSGTAALQIALLAAGVQPGAEVVVPALSFVSTAFAVQAVGAIPVFVDVLPDTLTMDPRAAQAEITDRTAAIVPVHMYGQMADMTEIGEVAAEHKLVVVEDCAQAHGAAYGPSYAGTLGDFGCFSLYAGKNIGGLEDGGLVCYRDERHGERVRRLRDLGRLPGGRYVHHDFGFRARMGEFNAAVIALQLGHLTDWNKRRQEIAAAYDEAFATSPVQPPTVRPGRTHVYYKYALLATDAAHRRSLETGLAERRIASERIYPTTIPDQPAYQKLPHRVGEIPIARDSVERLLCLPMFPELTDGEINEVIDSVTEILQQR